MNMDISYSVSQALNFHSMYFINKKKKKKKAVDLLHGQ